MRIRLFGSISVALVLAIALVLTGCGGGGGGQGGGGGGGVEQITVASDIAYPPFEFEKKGKPVGFDLDLMSEIGKRAGFKPEFQNVTFDGIIPGLGNNLYDAAISAMTITEEREQQIDFSDPYFNADQALLVASDSEVQSIDDLAEAPVGVQAGSTGQIKAEDLLEDEQIGEIVPYRTIGDAFVALEVGKVEGVIYDLSAAHRKIVESGGGDRVVAPISTGGGDGGPVPKHNAAVDPPTPA